MKILIVGRTSSGKDTLARELEKHVLRSVLSTTTRPRRTPDENTHVFVTPEEAEKLTDRVAYTKIGEYEYFATREQVENADIYVIDPRGMRELTENMPETAFMCVYVKADRDARFEHAVLRASDPAKAAEEFIKRDEAEDEQFSAFEDEIEESRICDGRNNATGFFVYENDYTQKALSDTVVMILAMLETQHHAKTILQELIEAGFIESDEDGSPIMMTDDKKKIPIPLDVTAAQMALRPNALAELTYGYYRMMASAKVDAVKQKENTAADDKT